MTAIATIGSLVLDCAEPVKLAEFYQRLTGLPVVSSTEDFVALGDGPVRMAFQRIAGYRAPDWPEDGARAHLDVHAPDPEAAVRDLLALGAARPEFQPGAGSWTVLTDPEGHPFCVMAS
jgi:hypothetical protein